jgi:hypothetical protein
MGKDTELREATVDLAEDIAEAENSKGVITALSSYLWKNVFPIMILGLFGLGTSNHLGMSSDVTNAHERVTDVQIDHNYRMTTIEANSDHRIKWTQEAMARLAAEGAATRKLLEEAQVVVGIMKYRLDRLEKELDMQGPSFGPPAAGDPEGGQRPTAKSIDFDELVKRLSKDLGKRPKVEPHDIQRYLNEQRPIQAPPMQRPIKGGYKK